MARYVQAHLPHAMSTHPDSSRGQTHALTGMLLAASMGALLLVADQLINSWSDGRLLAAWVALWALAIATLAMLTPPLRQICARSAVVIARAIALIKARHS